MTLRVGKPDDKKEKGGDKADDKVKYQYYPLWVCFTSEWEDIRRMSSPCH